MKVADFYAKGYYAGLAPEPRFDAVLKIASSIRGGRLLDIGCGDGTFTLQLKEALGAEEVVGVEVSAEAVLAARKQGMEAFQLDVSEQSLPFEDSYFDVIYCGEIIEHVFNPDHLLDEVHRLLRPGGTAIVTTPNLAGWPNRMALLLGYQPFPMAVSPLHEGTGKFLMRGSEGQWGHIRVFTLRALVELLRVHHFSIRRILGCPVTVKSSSDGNIARFIRMLDKAISRIPALSNRVMVVVQKEGGQ